MKKLLLLIAVVAMVLPGCGKIEDQFNGDVCSLMEDITFMEYCYDNFDVNKDGLLSQEEASSVYVIDISGLDIYSLSGIEAFTRLEHILAKSCRKLRKATFPSSIRDIDNEAFYGCTSLTSVTIPNSVTMIGYAAFEDCRSLTSVTIGNSVSWIADAAFEDCKSLTSVTIPDSVTYIGEGAFYNCTSLKEVYCKPTTPPTGDYYMFDNNASGRKIYVPTASVKMYKAKLSWKSYASDIVGYNF